MKLREGWAEVRGGGVLWWRLSREDCAVALRG